MNVSTKLLRVKETGNEEKEVEEKETEDSMHVACLQMLHSSQKEVEEIIHLQTSCRLHQQQRIYTQHNGFSVSTLTAGMNYR